MLTGKSPFEIVYGHLIPLLLDFSSIPHHGYASADATDFISDVKDVQRGIFEKLLVSTTKYKATIECEGEIPSRCTCQ